MRIGGLASGMDTEQMVKDLMKVERLRVHRFLQQEQRLKWRQEAFYNVNKTIANFILNSRKDLGLNQVSYTGAIQKNSIDRLGWIKKATSSNEGIATATATANALNGSHSIEVVELAKSASIISDGNVEAGLGIIGTVAFTLETKEGKSAEISLTLDANSTVHDVAKAINNANLGVSAAYDENLKRLMISAKNTGAENYIKVTLDNNNFVSDKLKLGVAVVGNAAYDAVKIAGKNSVINFNGVGMEQSSNSVSVFGFDIQLKAKGSTTINIDTNVDGIIEKIKGFVSQYNSLIDDVSKQLSQEVHRNFAPLTNEQKEAMSEKDIEKWEEKAKSGMLRNNETLSRMLQKIRGNLYKNVDLGGGNTIHLTDVGITTGTYQERGKLVIDEQKLRSAISENPNNVLDMFFKIPTTGLEGEAKLKETGLVQRLYDDLVAGMKETIRHSGPGEDAALFRNVQGNMLMDFVTQHSNISVITKDLTSLNTRIAREEQILINKEDRYWQRFAAMEKAMNSMSQQSAWLMSQLGMGQQ